MKRYRIFHLLFILLFPLSFQHTQAQYTIIKPHKTGRIIPKIGQPYKVIKVKDGDTVGILVQNQELNIRLAHIDCPEKKQPFGTKAKWFVSDACFGKFITIKGHQGFDRYGRLIAEIILPDGRNLNKELVKNGLAWHFIKYSTDMSYAKLELDARKKHLNIWNAPNPIAPWNWRKQHNNNATLKP